MKENDDSSERGAANLLIADDSATARRQVRKAFEGEGFAVVEASEGVEAMWRARRQRFDAVITDIHMPAMDGLEFLAGLRKLPGYADVPVYVLTSDCSGERMKQGMKLGATGWLVKPPDLVQLVALVRTTLLGPQRAQAGTRR